MTAETIAQKGARYLGEGRLTVTAVDGLTIRATCRGQGAVYHLGYSPGGWWCDCPARKYLCCHISALQSVTVTTPTERNTP